MTKQPKADTGNGVGSGPAASSAARPPRGRFAGITRAAVAALAVVLVLGAAMWILRSGSNPTLTQTNREENSGDLQVTFAGPAFSPQATVADLKQASVEVANELGASYPDSPDFWNVLAYLQFHLGNTPEAVKLWKRCLAANPQSGEALYCLGYIAHLEGDTAQAVERFRAALAASPDDRRIPLLLAEDLTRLGKPEEALPLLQEQLKSNRRSINAVLSLGQIYLDLGQYENARMVFEKAVEIDPNNGEAHYGLGTTWARLGDAEKARQAMTTFQGLAAQRRGQSVARVTGFDDMVKGREVAVLIHNKAGKAYSGLGNLKKAEEAWLKASVLDPKDVQSRKELAALYERTDRNGAALRVCEELRDIDPRSADYWLNVGVLNGRLARYDAALAAVEQAIQLDPNDPKYRRAYELIRSAR